MTDRLTCTYPQTQWGVINHRKLCLTTSKEHVGEGEGAPLERPLAYGGEEEPENVISESLTSILSMSTFLYSLFISLTPSFIASTVVFVSFSCCVA